MVGASRALLTQAAAVIFLTWPLAAHLPTHLPATSLASPFDLLFVGWSLAQQSRLAFADDGIYYPEPHSLFFGETGFGALPYFLPPFLASGNPTLALNLLFLGCTALTAAALHLVAERMTRSWTAGALAGWVYLTTPFVTWSWIPAAPNYAVLQYLPLLMVLVALPISRARAALRVAGLMIVQGLTSPYVAAAALAPPLVIAAGRIGRRDSRRSGVYLAGALALAAAAITTAYAGHLWVRLRDPGLAARSYWTTPVGVPLPSFGWARGLFDVAVPLSAYPLIAAGALIAWRRHRSGHLPGARAWRLAACWAAIGTFISIRPSPEWPWRFLLLPQNLVARWTPAYDVVRVPERLGVAGLMGHAVLVGLAWWECRDVSRRVGKPRVAAGMAAAAALLVGIARYAEYQRGLASPLFVWPQPYPLMRAIAPDDVIVPVLRAGAGPVLEVPVDPGPRVHAVAMYRSIFHGRPLLNGYSGFWPAGFEQRMELARALPDPAALDALRRETGLTAILVHTAALTPAARAAWMHIAQSRTPTPYRLLARNGPDLLFGV